MFWFKLLCRGFILPVIICVITAAPASSNPGAEHLLPSSVEFPGWELTAPAKIFDADTLWEPINGAADQYLQYDCRSLTMAYLKKTASEDEIAVEIYEMPDALHSFGVYAARKPSGEPVVKIGGEGYLESGNLSFFTGKYFVRLMAQSPDGSATETVKQLGLLISKKSGKTATIPEQFTRFPTEELVRNSFGYTAKNVWGIRDLNQAYSAQYRHDGTDATVYLISEPTEKAAVANLALIRKNMTRRKISDLSEITGPETKGFTGVLKYKGSVLCMKNGNNVVLVTGFQDSEWAGQLVEVLLRNLGKK